MSNKIDATMFSEVMPRLDAEATQQLRSNVETDGCLNHIVLARVKALGGKVFVADGHHRKELCEELGIKYNTVTLDFDKESDVMKWMIDFQEGQRNWTYAQKLHAIDVLRRKQAEEGFVTSGNKTPDSEGGRPVEPGSITQAAKQFGVAKPDLAAMAKVNDDGSESLKKAVLSGDVPVRKGARISKLPKREQSTAIKEGVDDERVTADKDLLDDTGEKLPTKLIDTFKARTTFDNALELLRQVSAALNPLMGNPQEDKGPLPGGEYLSRERQRVQQSLLQLRTDLNFARPYAPCPYPHGKDKCPACGGLGWVGKQAYKAAGKGKQ